MHATRYDAKMATSFEQFRASLTRAVGRKALGIEMSDAEAMRVAKDAALARAYYDNWVRQRQLQRPVTVARAEQAATPAAAVPTSKHRGWGVDLMIATAIVVVGIFIVGAIVGGNRGSEGSTVAEATSTPTLAQPDPPSAAAVLDQSAREQGWSVAQSGELYFKAIDPDSTSCGHYDCLWYNVQSTSGCASGVYIQADIMSNGTAVDWTNARSASIHAGEAVAVKLEDVRGLGDAFRVSQVDCLD